MSSLNRPSRLNRSTLGLFGLLLLAAGGYAVAASYGRLPWLNPDTHLVPGTARPPTWALVVTAVVAIVIGLLCIRWLGAQLSRHPKAVTWDLSTSPETGHTRLSTVVAVRPLVAEIATYPGVSTADADLTGTLDEQILVLRIKANQDADLQAIRQRVAQDGLPRWQRALGLESLQVRTEFRYTSTSGPRAR